MLTNVDKITIVSRASASPRPVSPNNPLNLAVGLALGLLVGITIAFLREIFDRTVKGTHYITDDLRLTILGNIPKLSQEVIDATTQKIGNEKNSNS